MAVFANNAKFKLGILDSSESHSALSHGVYSLVGNKIDK